MLCGVILWGNCSSKKTTTLLPCFQEHSQRFKIEHKTALHRLTLSDHRGDRDGGQEDHIRPTLLGSDASMLQQEAVGRHLNKQPRLTAEHTLYLSLI